MSSPDIRIGVLQLVTRANVFPGLLSVVTDVGFNGSLWMLDAYFIQEINIFFF